MKRAHHYYDETDRHHVKQDALGSTLIMINFIWLLSEKSIYTFPTDSSRIKVLDLRKEIVTVSDGPQRWMVDAIDSTLRSDCSADRHSCSSLRDSNKALDEGIKVKRGDYMSLKQWVGMHKHLSILLAMMLLLGLFVSVAPVAVCKEDGHRDRQGPRCLCRAA
jgi:hypothetical protein